MEIVLENKIRIDSHGITGIMDNKGYLLKYIRNIIHNLLTLLF